VSADAHILLVTVHHIAADAWSLAVVTHEVGDDLQRPGE
jgi:hypothetical protein